MNAAVLTMILIAGTGADSGTKSPTSVATNKSSTTATASDCGCDNGGHHGKKNNGDGKFGCGWGDMPQSCYNPSYGCYPGNERFVNRYPAFHGTYYRQAYNYRNLFDYPWHAGLYEPVSLFAYNVPAPIIEEERQPPRPAKTPIQGTGTLPRR